MAKKEVKKREPKHLPRDEFELEEIAFVLSEAQEANEIKMFTIYKRDKPLTGTIIKMDTNTKLIHIRDRYMDIHKVHFLDILSVSDAEF